MYVIYYDVAGFLCFLNVFFKGYLVLQDLLVGFESPSVMDCKMGVR